MQSLSKTPSFIFQEQFFLSNPIWTELMKAMKCIIDSHIVFLLDVNGYRTYQALKDFEDSDINDIEVFVRSGDLQERVASDKLHLYLGQISDPKKFKFLPGEKKLIKRMIEYIKKNHKEDDKPLGKNMGIYPLFKKRKPSDNCDTSAKKQKMDNATVVTLDLNSELVAIRKLIKEYFAKNNFPDAYTKLVATLPLYVKTMEKDNDASLTCKFSCPFCPGKEISAGYRERKSTWLLSNLNRHFQSHKTREDKIPGTVNTNFFQPTSEKTSTSTKNSEERPIEVTGSEEEDNNLTDAAEQSSQSSKGNPTPSCSLSSSHSGNKYSRLERRRRALGRHTPDQIRITAYFNILNDVETILRASEDMINTLKARCEELSFQSCSHGKFNVSNLLQMLMDSAIQNAGRKNHGQRYMENIKLFAAYLFMLGGRFLYEMLYKNLPASLPSISVVERTLREYSSQVIEGVFRFQELKEFLINNDLPLKVCISEDGTRVQPHFSYDPATNQIIGPVPPLAENGVPLSRNYPATSAAMITKHFREGAVASSGYAIMAQPLQKGAPSFCLTLFGTDNKFTSEQCVKRWRFIHEELKKIDIDAVAFSSDGDPKLLSAMHSHMFNPDCEVFELLKNWHFAAKGLNYTVIQDPIHAANKFKTRLNPSNFLPIGKFSASQTHLRELIRNQSKEKHGLTENDLDKEDKMNFNASVKISSERVTDLMEATIPGSEATVAYLTNMRYLIEACLDESLSPAEVLYKIWHCNHFLRYWKLWLLNHPTYKMEHFVTPNLYLCVEMIAHALTILLIKFRGENSPEFFLVSLFSSQTCEAFFRMARSMTVTHSTIINFSMKEFLHRVRRIDLLHFITTKLSDKLVFPREKRKKLLGILTKDKLQQTYLPTDAEICEIVLSAKADALSVLRGLGVNFSNNTSISRIRSYLLNSKQFEDSEDSVPSCSYLSTINEDDIPLDLLVAFPSPDDIPSLDPTEENIPREKSLPDDSKFVAVPQISGGFRIMMKSTFCWLLSLNGQKLSSDRLERVRQSICFNLQTSRNVTRAIEVGPQEEVEVGAWCIFKKMSKFYITQILGFTYLSGEGSSRSFTLPTAPTKPPSNKKKARGLGCLCTWYSYNQTGKLSKHEFKVQGYVNMTQYIATVPAPSYDSDLQISDSVLSYLRKL